MAEDAIRGHCSSGAATSPQQQPADMHPQQRRPPKGPPWPPNLGGCVRFSWFCVIWVVLWNSAFVISSGKTAKFLVKNLIGDKNFQILTNFKIFFFYHSW